jgi:DNA-binding NarL/FixJ family response regulator
MSPDEKSTPQALHFLLADNSAVVCQELRQFIASIPTWQVVAEAVDGQEAVHLASIHYPDVALVDVVMPGLDGIRAAQSIKAASPATRIIVYTAYHNGAFRGHALAAGADAFFWKEDLDLPMLEVLVAQWFGLVDG